jgi:hypothetical protein
MKGKLCMSPETGYVVAFYEMLPRGYGGPEEGGWFYDRGNLKKIITTTWKKEEAYRKAYRANRLLLWLQRHKVAVSSVLYTGGRFQAEVWEGEAPPFYPISTPRYE